MIAGEQNAPIRKNQDQNPELLWRIPSRTSSACPRRASHLRTLAWWSFGSSPSQGPDLLPCQGLHGSRWLRQSSVVDVCRDWKARQVVLSSCSQNKAVRLEV